ncbi:hypothetical protein [Saccharopolyspora hattusasensis]|uniref:hypothetical protein n=1 Tax=Saccharopolyspora hattusasensis TaxID=1128679 RepID=UPI003D963A03
MGTLRRELLDRILIYNEAPRSERAQRVHPVLQPAPPPPVPAPTTPDSTEPCAPATVTDLQAHRIRRQPILDGLINEYHHDAA